VNVVQPVVSILAVMLAVRLLGEKSPRHHLQIFVLSLFCLASSSLFDLSPRFLLYLALLLFMVAVSLVLLTFQVHGGRMKIARGDLGPVLAAGLLMPLLSLPLMILLFPLLPRTPFPLWNVFGAPAVRTSGLADRVEPGGSSAVGESQALVFRAEMPRQPQQQLYWRGTVFNRFDGTRWIRDRVPPETILYGQPRVSQVVFPEPGPSRFLVALDAPDSIAVPRAGRSADGVFELPAGSRRKSYAAESYSEGTLPVAGRIDRRAYLQLPPDIPERIKVLADDIRSRGTSDRHRLELLERHFRTSGYRYTLRDLPTGDHALERFLFETRQGHCEFFASAFAVVLRGAGVPSRLVGGYLGGEYNGLGGYYLVSERMAHVWVEAFVEGRWLRVDPSSYAGNAGSVWGGRPQRSLAMRLRLAIDSLDHAWNRSVITYDFERQADVARTAGRRLQGLDAGRVLKALPWPHVLPATLAIVAMIAVIRRRLLPTPAERLLRRFYRRVERDCGVGGAPGKLGLFELADRTGNARVRAFVDIYAGALYHDRPLSREEYARLKRMLREGFGVSPPSS
jgi:transglutaminase-like putative cysteine protease